MPIEAIPNGLVTRKAEIERVSPPSTPAIHAAAPETECDSLSSALATQVENYPIGEISVALALLSIHAQYVSQQPPHSPLQSQ